MFTHFSSVSIEYFEQVNVAWEGLTHLFQKDLVFTLVNRYALYYKDEMKFL